MICPNCNRPTSAGSVSADEESGKLCFAAEYQSSACYARECLGLALARTRRQSTGGEARAQG